MTDVLGIDLSDVPAGGAEDPLSQIVVDLAVSAATLAASPLDLIGAHVALDAMAGAVRDQMPAFAEVIDNLRRLLNEARAQLAEEANHD